MSKDLRFGPIWTDAESVEVHLPRPTTAEDREALRTGYIGPHILDSDLGEVLDAVAAMRQRRQPTNPARAMDSANKIRRMMAAVIDELMVAEMVGHGETGHVLGVSKSTAQSRREAARDAEADMEFEDWMYRYDVGLRERGSNARDWYSDDQTDTTEGTVVNIATGTVGIQSSGGTVTGNHVEM